MAKYKVLQKFRDKVTKEVYETGQEIEMTVKRADEAIKNLKKWDGEFLERVEEKEWESKVTSLHELSVQQLREFAKENDIEIKVAAKKEDIIEAIQEYELTQGD